MPFAAGANADRIYWKRDGLTDGRVLILLNSIGTDMDLWDDVLPLLRSRFALLRIDTRGHGASDAPCGDYSLALLADDVMAVVEAAGVERFSLVGVSLGGMIAMELALRVPMRVEKLVPVCTSATMDSAAWNDRIAMVRGQGMAAIADLAMGRFLSASAERPVHETVRRQLLAMNPDGYAGCGAAIRDMDLHNKIANIACPTLIVTGARDSSTPFEGHGDYLLKHIVGAEHIIVAAAHLAPLEAPEALAEGIIAFLES